MSNKWICLLTYAAVCAATLSAWQKETARGTPLRLVTPAPTLPRPLPNSSTPPPAEQPVRPAILILKPAGDPIYLTPDPDSGDAAGGWRTYQPPKVDAFSRNGDGAALHGYDLVSYHENHPEPGSKEFAVTFAGVTWLFVSAEHREIFLRDPNRFLPAYGGFCAYSVSRGYPATADPRAFTLSSGTLYLFFDKAVQSVWEQNKQRYLSDADHRWPQLHR